MSELIQAVLDSEEKSDLIFSDLRHQESGTYCERSLRLMQTTASNTKKKSLPILPVGKTDLLPWKLFWRTNPLLDHPTQDCQSKCIGLQKI